MLVLQDMKLSLSTRSSLVTSSLQFSLDVLENLTDSGCIVASVAGTAIRPAGVKAGDQSAVLDKSKRIRRGQLSLWMLAQI